MRNQAIASLALALAMGCGGVPDDQGQNEDGLDQTLESGEKSLGVMRVNTFTTTTPAGDQADVYYPTTRRPLPADSLPVVSLTQGALVDKSLYSEYATQLSRFGFVVVVPNHYASLFPGAPPQLFTNQMVIHDVLALMAREDADASSPLHEVVDTSRLGLTGHSFGGAAALFAVEGSCKPPFCFGFFPPLPQLKGAALWGTHTVQNGMTLPVDTSKAPVALLQGELDNPNEAGLTYEQLEKPRALILFEGMNHYGITNINNPPGAKPDPSAPTVEQEQGIKRLARWTGLYLRATVHNDPRAARIIYESGGNRGGSVTVTAERY